MGKPERYSSVARSKTTVPVFPRTAPAWIFAAIWAPERKGVSVISATVTRSAGKSMPKNASSRPPTNLNAVERVADALDDRLVEHGAKAAKVVARAASRGFDDDDLLRATRMRAGADRQRQRVAEPYSEEDEPPQFARNDDHFVPGVVGRELHVFHPDRGGQLREPLAHEAGQAIRRIQAERAEARKALMRVPKAIGRNVPGRRCSGPERKCVRPAASWTVIAQRAPCGSGSAV